MGSVEELVGRQRERGEIASALAGARGPGAILLEGDAGIGKTALWQAALALAEESGHRCLVARAVLPESELGFAAACDLIGSGRDALDDLPPPQREALEIAVLRERDGPLPDAHVVALAFAAAIRSIARRRQLVLAVDDVQWLDEPSARLLAFALRRLVDEPVTLLATHRGASGSALPSDLDAAVQNLVRIDVGPLTLGAVAELIHRRLGLTFARPALRRLHEASGGNPFYALELARAFQRHGDPAFVVDLPVPMTLRDLVRERLDRLPGATTEALRVVALAGDPTLELVERTLGRRAALEPAFEAQVLAADGPRVRFSHPLLAAAVADAMTTPDRDGVHRALAAAVTSAEERALHLSAATRDPDSAIAAMVEETARTSAARGASRAAALLAVRAVDLTPADDVFDRARRMSFAGRAVATTGDAARSNAMLNAAVELLPEGRERAAALADLLDSPATIDPLAVGLQALREAEDDSRLRALVQLRLSEEFLVKGDVDAALRSAEDACANARREGDPLLIVAALARYGATQARVGLPEATEHLREALALHEAAGGGPVEIRPAVTLAMERMWVDDLATARDLLLRDLELIRAHEDDWLVCNALLHLARTELRMGYLADARRRADEADAIAHAARFGQIRAGTLSIRALTAAHTGPPFDAIALAAESDAIAEAVDDRWFPLFNRHVRVLAHLAAGMPAEAAQSADGLGEAIASTGVRNPGIFPFEGDAVEALVAIGEIDAAEDLVERLCRREDARSRASGSRGRGLTLASRGEIGPALAAFAEAVECHGRLGDPFQLARTLLVRGVVERRARRRADAARTLAEAERLFEELGAAPWAERARGELARIGGRRSSARELTPTEQRVAELVAAGRTNKEAAAELFVTVRAIEANLSRIYTKLGIRSRSELARTLAARDSVSAT